MRFVLKMLSILIIGGTTAFNVVACNNNSGQEKKSYNVSFKRINKLNGWDFGFKGNHSFVISKEWVEGSNGLPSGFWSNQDEFTTMVAKKDNIWDSIASVYGFTRTSSINDIHDTMLNKPLINVSMNIIKGEYSWEINSFQLN